MGMGLAEGCAAEERREWCKSGPPGTLFVPIAGDLLPVRELNFAREKQPQPGRPVATVRSLSIMVRLVDRNSLLTPRKAGPLLGYGNRFFFGMNSSAFRSPRGLRLRHLASKGTQDVPNDLVSVGGLWKRQVVLNLIAIATSVSLLHDVAGFGQIVDNSVGTPFGEVETGRDIAQAHLRIASDAEECPTMVAEESPSGHGGIIPAISRNILLVARY